MSGARRPRARHRAEFALLRAGLAVARRLPADSAARLGARLSGLAYRPLSIRRELVEQHLRFAFPDRDEAWIRNTAQAAYAHIGRELISMLRMADAPREALIESTSLHGLEPVREAVDTGRGVVLVTGHFGNWEIGAASVAARGLPVDIVVQPQRNPLFDRLIHDARVKLGVNVIAREKAPRLAIRALRAGRVVVFAADQDARSNGIFVPFFGRPASTHRGPALMAYRTDSLLLGLLARRAEDGRYDVRLDPVEASRHGHPDDVVQRLTAAFTAILEDRVRESPDQYFWLHRRWKTRPPTRADDEPSPLR